MFEPTFSKENFRFKYLTAVLKFKLDCPLLKALIQSTVKYGNMAWP